MNTDEKILVSLIGCRSTDAAIGDTLRLPFLVTRAHCQRMEKDGFIASEKISDVLPVWHLTESGKARAEKLQSAAV